MESFPATNDCSNLRQPMTDDAKGFAFETGRSLGHLRFFG
jgi:hypothetical protein